MLKSCLFGYFAAMQIIVLADAVQQAALQDNTPLADVVWVKDAEAFLQYKNADAFIDLEFINDEKRKVLLTQLLPALVIVNSVTDTLQNIHPDFIRINAWPTFLNSSLLEGFCADEQRPRAGKVLALFAKKVHWLPDEPGFVTARVISMIINEAFLSLAEGVSTKEEINTAMKLGTAYPHGPFEWAEKIGVQNVVTLLQELCKTEGRYVPAELLVQETNKGI